LKLPNFEISKLLTKEEELLGSEMICKELVIIKDSASEKIGSGVDELEDVSRLAKECCC
jgi:hypothetical protein